MFYLNTQDYVAVEVTQPTYNWLEPQDVFGEIGYKESGIAIHFFNNDYAFCNTLQTVDVLDLLNNLLDVELEDDIEGIGYWSLLQLEKWYKSSEYAKRWEWNYISAYDYSYVTYSRGVHCSWDSGVVAVALVDLTEFESNILDRLLNTASNYHNGWSHEVHIYDLNGEEIDYQLETYDDIDVIMNDYHYTSRITRESNYTELEDVIVELREEVSKLRYLKAVNSEA